MAAPIPNAVVDYINAKTGAVLERSPFYDPGLDEHSWLAREEQARGTWRGSHLAYGCGAALTRSAV